MRGGRALSVCTVLCLAMGCAPQQKQLVEEPAQPKEAKGRVTRLDSAHAPQRVPLAPEVIVKAPPFVKARPGTEDDAVAHTRTWTTEDGLPSDYILCCASDVNGMLWFGSNGAGLGRFDGRTFTTFDVTRGLMNNVILCLRSDRQGNLWIGTNELQRYDGRTFTTFPIAGGRGVNRIWEDMDGTLWFGTRGHGLQRYDGQHFSRYTNEEGLPSLFVQGIVRGPDSALWVSTTGGVCRFDGTRFRAQTGADGAPLRDVIAMVRGAHNDLWLGHAGGGLTHARSEKGTLRMERDPVITGERVAVNDLYTDAAGSLWLATVNHGVIRYEPRAEGPATITRFTPAQGFASNEVVSITADGKGELWFGTTGAGVTQYHGPAFSTFHSIKVLNMAEDPQGTLWSGTEFGLARLDGRSFHEQRIPGLPRFGLTYSTRIDPLGRVGFAVNLASMQRHGSSWFDGTHYHVVQGTDDLMGGGALAAHFDKKGRFWCPSKNGLECFGDGYRTTYAMPQGVAGSATLCLSETPDGAIWVGTEWGGVSRIDSDDLHCGRRSPC